MTDVSNQIWRLTNASTKKIVCLKEGVGIPLYLIHSAGGGIGGLDHLAKVIQCRNPIYGVQSILSEMVGNLNKNIEEIGLDYAEIISIASKERTLILGGYSSGAAVALATAHGLQNMGREIPLLIAIDGAPWRDNVTLPSKISLSAIETIGRVLDRLIRIDLNLWKSSKNLSILWNQTPINHPYVERLINSALSKSHRAYVESVLAALYTYRPANFTGEVLLLESERQPLLYDTRAREVWQALARSTTSVVIPGHHGSLAEGMFDTIAACAKAVERRLLEEDLSGEHAHNASLALHGEIEECSKTNAFETT